MNEPDGSIMSLVNGHVMRLLDAVERSLADDPAAVERVRVKLEGIAHYALLNGSDDFVTGDDAREVLRAAETGEQ